jgi:uncharacterized protein (DUF4415 family)
MSDEVLGEVFIDVTVEQYQAMQAKGIDEDALLEPGRHKFMRGLFKQRHPDYVPAQAQVRLSIQLDADVLSWLRARATVPYQAQINAELRALMERETARASSTANTSNYVALLNDANFIAAVAERVKQAPPSRKARRKAA